MIQSPLLSISMPYCWGSCCQGKIACMIESAIDLPTGKQLASTAVSLRPGSASSDEVEDKAGSSRQARDNAISTEEALDLLDAKEAQTGD